MIQHLTLMRLIQQYRGKKIKQVKKDKKEPPKKK